MKSQPTPYIKQIFVCVNDAKGEKASCGDHHGEEIFKQLRQIAKDRGIHPKVRVAQAKCLGQCSTGCNIMIYPDNIWVSGVEVANVPDIVESHFPKIQ